MRKIISVTSLVLSGLAFSLPTYASETLRIHVDCPDKTSLANYQGKVIGNGTETVFVSPPETTTIRFTSAVDVTQDDFSNYYPQSVNYSSSSGIVSCYFQSPDLAKPSFYVSYPLMNAQGGVVVNSSNSFIDINVPVGLGKS